MSTRQRTEQHVKSMRSEGKPRKVLRLGSGLRVRIPFHQQVFRLELQVPPDGIRIITTFEDFLEIACRWLQHNWRPRFLPPVPVSHWVSQGLADDLLLVDHGAGGHGDPETLRQLVRDLAFAQAVASHQQYQTDDIGPKPTGGHFRRQFASIKLPPTGTVGAVNLVLDHLWFGDG
jgi:hypothetical protein